MQFTMRRLLVGFAIVCVLCYGALRFIEMRANHHADSLLDPGYSQIDDKLYLGAWVAAPPADTLAVLNLCEHEDPYHCEIHLWKPIRDAAPAPSIAWLRQHVAFVAQQQRAGRVTYVHCFNGASRSGMVVVAYIMQHRGWRRDRAIDHVRSKRPQLRPNPAFMELLKEWEVEIK